MKTIVTALGVFAVLLASVTAYATAFTWDGSYSSAWDTPANWTAGSGYPGELGCTDTATIDESQNPPNWPQLNSGDVCVAGYTMSDDSSLDVNGNTLYVDGTATFSDPTSDSDASNITISGGTADPDGIIAETMVFDGGEDGLTVTLSGTTKLQTAPVTP